MGFSDLFNRFFEDLLDYNNWVDVLYEETNGYIGLAMLLVFNIIHIVYYIVQNRETVRLNYNLFETMLFSAFLTIGFGLILWWIELLRELSHFAYFALELCIAIGFMIYYKYHKV